VQFLTNHEWIRPEINNIMFFHYYPQKSIGHESDLLLTR